MLKEEKKIFTDEDAADAFYRFAGLEHEDISEDIAPIYNEEMKMAGVPVVFHEVETNGIGYLELMFDLSEVPEEVSERQNHHR